MVRGIEQVDSRSISLTSIVQLLYCTYIEGAYATKISVTFPGQGAIEVEQNDLYASTEYISTGHKDHDYGLILLPGNSDGDGFGWSAIIPNGELNNRLVTNCGFPADKPAEAMWITGGAIERYTSQQDLLHE